MANGQKKIRTVNQEFNYRKDENGDTICDVREPTINKKPGKLVAEGVYPK